MFSGIIDRIGRVAGNRQTAAGSLLQIEAAGYWSDLQAGASIAIDGVCLTLTGAQGSVASFDVISETLRRTTLGSLSAGDEMNLQKSLMLGDRVDGHFVQGHIDAVAKIVEVNDGPADVRYWFGLDGHTMPYIIPKGSVAIDGISLTIAEVEQDRFAVALIPVTLERTTLGRKRVGARVNIETDVIARTIVHHARSMAMAEHVVQGGFAEEDPR